MDDSKFIRKVFKAKLNSLAGFNSSIYNYIERILIGNSALDLFSEYDYDEGSDKWIIRLFVRNPENPEDAKLYVEYYFTLDEVSEMVGPDDIKGIEEILYSLYRSNLPKIRYGSDTYCIINLKDRGKGGGIRVGLLNDSKYRPEFLSEPNPRSRRNLSDRIRRLYSSLWLNSSDEARSIGTSYELSELIIGKASEAGYAD